MGRGSAGRVRLPARAPARGTRDPNVLIARLRGAMDETASQPLSEQVIVSRTTTAPGLVIITHVEWPEPQPDRMRLCLVDDLEELGQEILALARRYAALDGVWVVSELMAWDPNAVWSPKHAAPPPLAKPTLRCLVPDFPSDGRAADGALLVRRSRALMRRFTNTVGEGFPGGIPERFAVMEQQCIEFAVEPEDLYTQGTVRDLAGFTEGFARSDHLGATPSAFLGLFDLFPLRGSAPREIPVKLGVDIEAGGVVRSVWET